jgi:hypothetical protein
LRNVLERSGMTVSLGETKIDTVDKVSIAASSVRNKVGRFDITMDQVTGVHQFDTFQHLIGNHEYGLEGETASAFVELIFQGRTEQIHHH